MLSTSGDTIIVVSKNVTLTQCGSGNLLNKSLSIIGDTSTVLPQISSAINCSFIFEILHANVTFAHLNFSSGYVVAKDSYLVFNHCIFVDFVMFGMTTEIANLYLMHTSENDINLMILNYEPCYKITIEMMSCEWHHLPEPETILTDTNSIDGIQVMCQEVDVRVSDTFMADKEVSLKTSENSVLKVTNSTFDGTGSLRTLPGGLFLEMGSDPMVTIESCSFIRMRYSDIAILSSIINDNDQNIIGALTINAWEFTSKADKATHLVLKDTYFLENQGAITLKVFGLFKTEIENCTFDDNQALDGGGAIGFHHHQFASSSRKKPHISIINCVFNNNKAGVNPFNMGAKHLNEQLSSWLMTNVTQVDIKAHLINVHLIETMQLGNLKARKILTFHLKGLGGAIMTTGKYSVNIINSSFINNSATMYGGAFYRTEYTKVDIMHSYLQSSNSKSQGREGVLIHSSGTLSMENLEMIVTSVPDEKPSAIYYKYKDLRDELHINDIKLLCPSGSKIKYENATTADAYNIGYLVLANELPGTLSFYTLTYTCALCDQNFYTIEQGKISVQKNNNTLVSKITGTDIWDGVLSSHDVEVTDLECHECPYGGHCGGTTVGSKANYWGMTRDNLMSFYRCPNSYCCAESSGCERHDTCAANRDGTLCGRCAQGFSEAMFSTNCIPNNDCRDFWIFPFTFSLTVVYALFLLFQNDFKNFVFSVPVGKVKVRNQYAWKANKIKDCSHLNFYDRSNVNELVLKSRSWNKMNHKNLGLSDNTRKIPSEVEMLQEVKNEEGGIFLILMFYYFQDASIIHFKTVFVKEDRQYISLVKQIIGGLFKFRIDLISIAGNVCAISDLTPVTKLLLKLAFVVGLLLMLYLFFVASKLRRKQTHSNSTFSSKAAVAMTLALLFSFQRLAYTFFSLVHCTPVAESDVLFIDGNIQCYTYLQLGAITFLALCIVPFPIYLALAPSWLMQGNISLNSFFLGCLFPFPMTMIWLIRSILTPSRLKKCKFSKEAKQLHDILQGPYKEYKLPLIPMSFCWSGVLLTRRLCLIIVHTFINDAIRRLSFMFVVCFLSLLHHFLTWPCKEKRANIGGLISNSALLLVCFINFFRAAYESAEYEPTGPNSFLIQIFNKTEEVLLLWIPLLGASCIILFLLFRICMKLYNVLSLRESRFKAGNTGNRINNKAADLKD